MLVRFLVIFRWMYPWYVTKHRDILNKWPLWTDCHFASKSVFGGELAIPLQPEKAVESEQPTASPGETKPPLDKYKLHSDLKNSCSWPCSENQRIFSHTTQWHLCGRGRPFILSSTCQHQTATTSNSFSREEDENAERAHSPNQREFFQCEQSLTRSHTAAPIHPVRSGRQGLTSSFEKRPRKIKWFS